MLSDALDADGGSEKPLAEEDKADACDGSTSTQLCAKSSSRMP